MSSIRPGLFPVRSLLRRCSSDDAAIEIEILVFMVSPDASGAGKGAFTRASDADFIEIFGQAPGRLIQRLCRERTVRAMAVGGVRSSRRR